MAFLSVVSNVNLDFASPTSIFIFALPSSISTSISAFSSASPSPSPSSNFSTVFSRILSAFLISCCAAFACPKALPKSFCLNASSALVILFPALSVRLVIGFSSATCPSALCSSSSFSNSAKPSFASSISSAAFSLLMPAKPFSSSISSISASISFSDFPVFCLISIFVLPFLFWISTLTSAVLFLREIKSDSINAFCCSFKAPFTSILIFKLLLASSISFSCSSSSFSISISSPICLVASSSFMPEMLPFTFERTLICSSLPFSAASSLFSSAMSFISSSLSLAISMPFLAFSPLSNVRSRLRLSNALSKPHRKESGVTPAGTSSSWAFAI